MFTPHTGLRSPTPLGYLACYSLYALLLAGSVVAWLIWRTTILHLIARLIGLSPVNASIYAVSMIVLGLGLFALVIAAEPYLRTGVKRGQLVSRFARLALPLLAAGLLGLLLGIWL